MKKNLVVLALSALLLTTLSGCSNQNNPSDQPSDPVVETFSAEYEMFGTTSAGLPKNDTFIFEGKTTDGIITELNFDIIRNKGLEGEYSKKSLMGYQMNVSDAVVSVTENGFKLDNLGMNGYNNEFGQFMITATCDNLTEDTTFKDLTIKNYTGIELTPEQAYDVYKFLAKEGNVDLTEDTFVSDLLVIHGLYKENEFQAGSSRVSFEGINGGRSYGEQIDAIVAYVLANNMTLEDVYNMFKTVNQQSQPIEERDTITGATIAFVGDFQRTVYLAIHGEIYEGVTNTSTTDGITKVEVVTQGFAGEIETHVSFDAEGKIVAISIRDHQETADYGATLAVEGSEFIQSLIDNQDNLDAVDTQTGATSTANALVKAVEYAIESNK